MFNTFIYLALMIFTAMAFGRLAKLAHLPNVTGYIVAGLIIGPSVLGLIPENAVGSFSIISEIALGLIAFSVGSEFRISYFRRVGATPIIIAAFEALLASVCVTAALVLTGHDVAFSLLLGAIASATAPAATIMVIKQYRAKGPVTETLLSVVAIDDAAALMLFGIAVSIAQMLQSPHARFSVMTVAKPLYEIALSLLIGVALGSLLTFFLRFFKKDGNRISLTLGFVLCGVGAAAYLNLSSLLLCMALGMALSNLSKVSTEILRLTDYVTPPIFMLFFVDSGAELKLSILPSIGVIGVLYLISRVIGKCLGAYLGARIAKAPENVRRYLGGALVPQAGVAIGLSLLATRVVPMYGDSIRAVILCGTLIYELVGPAITKISLKKAGEIQ
ncbi:MAG: cation:proton antiporter [Clostridia bacterium]|nr:cation:proton antiporter [Clostridia bacterium]